MTTLSVQDLIVEVRDVNAQVLGRVDPGFLNGAVLPARVNDVTAWSLTLPEKVHGELYEPTTWLRRPGAGIVVRIEGQDGTFLSGPMAAATRHVSAFGEISWKFEGVSDETILAGAVAARNPAKPLDQQYQEKPVPVTGDAAVVLAQLVSRNAGPDAHATRKGGIRSKLRVSNSAATSTAITVHPAGETLLALLQEWSKDRPFHWRVRHNRADGLIYFTVLPMLDRTDEVRFDMRLDTVAEQTTVARAPEATTVIGVGGVGEAVVSDAPTLAEWGIPREVTVDQSSVTDINQLGILTLQQLEASKASQGFAIVPRDDVATPAMLGSVVAVNIGEEEPYLARLNEVLVTVTDGAVHVSATIGNTDGTDWESTVDTGLARLAERVSSLERAPKTAELNRVPVAPTALDVQSSSFTTTKGIPQARVTVACTAPATGTDTLPLELQGIELWGAKQGETMRRLTSSPSSPIVFDPLPVGESWSFKVRSISTNGKASAFSATKTVTLTSDTTPPPAPSKPALSSDLGIVTVTFDGKTSTGGTQPADYDYTAVVVGGAEVGRIDPTTGVASAYLTGLTGSVTVRLRSYDTSGNPSALSDPATITVKSVLDNTDIANLAGELADAQDRINNALSLAATANTTATTADGRLTVSPNAPTNAAGAGKAAGSLWFRKDSGSQTITGVWEWSGATWYSRAITDAVIANLDAGKINAGYLDVANRIAANTITARKLVLGDSTNLIADPNFRAPLGESWQAFAGASDTIDIVDTSGGPGPALRLVRGGTNNPYAVSAPFALKPGDELLMRFRGQANAGMSVRLRIVFYDRANALIDYQDLIAPTGTGWADFSKPITASPGTVWAEARIYATSGSGTVWVSNPGLYRMAGAELIVDGAVTARTITASEELSAKVGQFLTLDVGKLRAGSGAFDTAVAGLLRTTVLVANAITAQSGVLANASVTRAAIADLAVNNAKIADLDVGKLRASSGRFDTAVADLMRTTVLEADAIKANMIAIGDFENLVAGSDFEDPARVPWDLAGDARFGLRTNTDYSHSGVNHLGVSPGSSPGVSYLSGNPRFEVKEGDQLYIELWARRTSAFNGTRDNSKLSVRGQSGLIAARPYALADLPTANVWQKLTATVKIPPGNTSIYFDLRADHTDGYLYLDDIVIRRMAGGELIVDGAIRANHLTVDQAFIDKLFVNNLLANALTGKTIEGAIVRSSTSLSRVEIADGRFQMWNGSGGTTFFLNQSQLTMSGPSVAMTTPSFYVTLDNDYTSGGPSTRQIAFTATSLGPQLLVAPIYTSTTTSEANVSVASGGKLYRSTSVRAAKLAIEDQASPGILRVQYRSWFDKRAMEEAVLGERPAPERRIVGAVAEEMEQVAPELCTYDESGNLTGIAYDRVALALIPVLRDLTNRIESLEGKPLTEWPASPVYDDDPLMDEITSAWHAEEQEAIA